MHESYQPIDCDLYDELVALIMHQQHCTIQYWNAQGQKITIDDQPIDVYSQEKQEFLKLKSGTVIRLDALIAVNHLRFQK